MFGYGSKQRRFAGAALASLWLLLWMLPLLHASHQHRYCDEHQVVEDVTGGEATTAATASADADADASVHPSEAGGDTEKHAACSLLASQQRSLKLPEPSQAVAVRSHGILLAVLTAVGGFSPLSVLAAAPKSSPPQS